MTKKLLLIRHAHAAESSTGQKDFDRTLTSKGTINAAQLGFHISKANLRPDAFFSSDAIRAHDTAQTIAGKINFDVNKIKWEHQLYETSTRGIMEIVNEFDELWKTVAIVGHNPVMTYFAEYLSGEMIGNMSPSSLAVLSFDLESWKEVSGKTARLTDFFEPKE